MLPIICVVAKAQTLADGTIQLRLNLNETSETEMAELFKFAKAETACYLMLKETPQTEEDFKNLPDIKPIEKNEKHPSVRLRGIIFRAWELSKKDKDFDNFYREKMELLIDVCKSRWLDNYA